MILLEIIKKKFFIYDPNIHIVTNYGNNNFSIEINGMIDRLYFYEDIKENDLMFLAKYYKPNYFEEDEKLFTLDNGVFLLKDAFKYYKTQEVGFFLIITPYENEKNLS